MKFEEQEVFIVWHNDGSAIRRIYDSRNDALRFTNGHGSLIERKRVIPYSGKGPYRKPYVYPVKKRVKK